MKLRKRIKFCFLFLILLLCFSFQTIAFSSLSGIVNITGNAYARMAKNVRITDFGLYSSSNVVVSYNEFSKDTVTIGFTLESNASVSFRVDITNYNSNKIGIYSITGLPSGLSYNIANYTIGTPLLSGIGSKSFYINFTGTAGTYNFTLNLDFRKIYDITYDDRIMGSYSSYIFENETKTINFTDESFDDVHVYVNNDYTDFSYENNSLVLNNVTGDVEVVYVDVPELGTMYCFDKECFYTVGYKKPYVRMMTKYNLMVGNYMSEDWEVYPLEDMETGIQDSLAIGYNYNATTDELIYPFYGTIAFSDSDYWSSLNTYPFNVLDRLYFGGNPYLHDYLEFYAHYMIDNFGLYLSYDADLITYEELVNLGCDVSSNSCSNAMPFVYLTSYWSGSAYDEESVYSVLNDGGFFNNLYDDNMLAGIRPVIDVPVDYTTIFTPFYIEFESYAASYSENQLNTNYMAVPAGMTWGEWVNSSFNDMKFLSVSGGLIIMENSQNVIADLDKNKYVCESDVIRENGHYRIQIVV